MVIVSNFNVMLVNVLFTLALIAGILFIIYFIGLILETMYSSYKKCTTKEVKK